MKIFEILPSFASLGLRAVAGAAAQKAVAAATKKATQSQAPGPQTGQAPVGTGVERPDTEKTDKETKVALRPGMKINLPVKTGPADSPSSKLTKPFTVSRRDPSKGLVFVKGPPGGRKPGEPVEIGFPEDEVLSPQGTATPKGAQAQSQSTMKAK